MSSVCYLDILIFDPYVTRIYSYVIRMSLLCGIAVNRFNDTNVLKEEKLREIIFNLT